MSDFAMTPHRAKILQVLLEQGEINDPDGQSTTLLMAETGHRTSNALSGVLLAMEKAGLVERDKAGRRTYRIALTREGRKAAERLKGTDPGTVASEAPKLTPDPDLAATVANGAVDLDMLAGVLLKKALLATQAQEDSAAAKDALRRAERAEATLEHLDAELKKVRNEAAELRAQIKTLEHNNTVLANQMDKVRKNPGTPVKDLISKREQQELAKLMRQLPTARG